MKPNPYTTPVLDYWDCIHCNRRTWWRSFTESVSFHVGAALWVMSGAVALTGVVVAGFMLLSWMAGKLF